MIVQVSGQILIFVYYLERGHPELKYLRVPNTKPVWIFAPTRCAQRQPPRPMFRSDMGRIGGRDPRGGKIRNPRIPLVVRPDQGATPMRLPFIIEAAYAHSRPHSRMLGNAHARAHPPCSHHQASLDSAKPHPAFSLSARPCAISAR